MYDLFFSKPPFLYITGPGKLRYIAPNALSTYGNCVNIDGLLFLLLKWFPHKVYFCGNTELPSLVCCQLLDCILVNHIWFCLHTSKC